MGKGGWGGGGGAKTSAYCSCETHTFWSVRKWIEILHQVEVDLKLDIELGRLDWRGEVLPFQHAPAPAPVDGFVPLAPGTRY